MSIDEILSPGFVQRENYNWYFLRVSYGRAAKLYDEIHDKTEDFLVWLPYLRKVRYDNGKKFTSFEPIFKGNLFVYGTKEHAESLTRRMDEKGNPYVGFYYDHARKTKYGRDETLIVPFDQMKSFVKAERVYHPWACVVSEEQIHFREGGKVRVKSGPFEGVEGRVARVLGQTRVVVTIPGIVNYATSYISTQFLEPIE